MGSPQPPTAGVLPLNPPLRRRGEDCCHAAKLKVALACLVLVEERAPHPILPFPLACLSVHPDELQPNLGYCSTAGVHVIGGRLFQPIGQAVEGDLVWGDLRFQCVIYRTTDVPPSWAAFTLGLRSADRPAVHRFFHLYRPGAPFVALAKGRAGGCCKLAHSLLTVLHRNERLSPLLGLDVSFEPRPHPSEGPPRPLPAAVASEGGAAEDRLPPQVPVPTRGDTRRARFLNVALRQLWMDDPHAPTDRLLAQARQAWRRATPAEALRVVRRHELPAPEEGPAQCRACGDTVGGRSRCVRCSACHATFHELCLPEWRANLQAAGSGAWLCADCKVCEVCAEGGGESGLLLCEQCDRAAHARCLRPSLRRAAAGGRFLCGRCQRGGGGPPPAGAPATPAGTEDSEPPAAAAAARGKRSVRGPGGGDRPAKRLRSWMLVRDCLQAGYLKLGDRLLCGDLTATVVDCEGTLEYRSQGQRRTQRALARFARDAGCREGSPTACIRTEDGLALQQFKGRFPPDGPSPPEGPGGHSSGESSGSSSAALDSEGSFTNSNHYLSNVGVSGEDDSDGDGHALCCCGCACCQQLRSVAPPPAPPAPPTP